MSIIAEASLEQAMKIICEIDFPTLPLYLQLIQKEMSRKHPSFTKISDFISQDIALTAKILKTVNSAAFSTKYRIENIHQALTTLGLTNFYNAVLADSIKNQMKTHHLSQKNFNRIWHHSTAAATACQKLAEAINDQTSLDISFDVNHAYLTGLFHDCGIPIMAARFSDYEENSAKQFESGFPLIDMENDCYQTDHSIVCYIVAKMWELPEPVRNAIYYHSDMDLGYYKEIEHRQLSVLLRMAESFLTDIDISKDSIEIFVSDGLSLETVFTIAEDELGIDRDMAEELYSMLEREHQ